MEVGLGARDARFQELQPSVSATCGTPEGCTHRGPCPRGAALSHPPVGAGRSEAHTAGTYLQGDKRKASRTFPLTAASFTRAKR